MKSDLTSRQQGAAKLLRCSFWQLIIVIFFRKNFLTWRATWRHDNWVLPNFSVAISGNYFTFIFSENNFIREERLDVTTTGCCQTSPLQFLAINYCYFFRKQFHPWRATWRHGNRVLPNFSLPFPAITLLLSFPKTISSVKSDLTSRQLCAAKFLRCLFWQLLYFYLFRKQFHSWRATWRHDSWVLPNFSVAISGNYFTFIFSKNNFIGEERLDVTITGCCQTSTLPFLAITLLLSSPKLISSVKSDLTSRQLGAAKLLRCHFWLWSFLKTISFVKSDLTSRQLGAAKLLRCHFWLWSFPKTNSSVKSDLTSRQQGAAKLFRCHFWQLLYCYLSRKQFHPWRATWRHDNWVLPNFYVAISGNYFTFIFSENNFIREEWLDVTTTECWKTSPLQFLAITLLLSFPKTFSSVKSNLTSRQQGAAKLLRCSFWQLLYCYFFRKQFHTWRATWRHDNRVLPNFSLPLPAIILILSFPKLISSLKSDLTSRQPGAAKLLRCHFWQILYFYLFRKQFHPWRATWRHDTWVLPFFSVPICGNYFTFIYSENNFIREERLDVTTTMCCQISPLLFLAITLLLSFPKTFSSVKSNFTSRQLGAAKLLRCHFWQLLYFYLLRKQFHPWRATWCHDNWVLPNFYVAVSGKYFTFIFSENIFIREERLDVTTTGCCQFSLLPFLAITLILSFPKTISSVKSDLTSRQLCAAKFLR